jgi:hypothetical protein
MKWRRLFTGSLILILLCLAGCQKVPVKTGFIEREIQDAGLSSKQLRFALNDFVLHFSDRIEYAADDIYSKCSDSEIRRNTLLWKIYGIPACLRAAAREDPMGALLDLWVLCWQMEDFFEDGAGSAVFGPWQLIAIDVAKDLKQKIEQIAELLAPTEEKFLDVRTLVNSFVKRAPLENLYFNRESLLKEFIEEVDPQAKKLMEVVGDVTESLSALQEIILIFADLLPKQLRWQIQLVLLDAEQLPLVSKGLADFTSISEAVSRMTKVAEELPALIERERIILLDEVIRQRIESFEEVEEMRLDTLQYVQQERIALLQAFHEEIIASFEEIDKQRVAVTGDAQVMMLDTTNRIMHETKGLIDHFIWRMLQLGALFLIVIVILFLIGRRLFK